MTWRKLGTSALGVALVLGAGCESTSPRAEVVLAEPPRSPPPTIYGRDPPPPPRDDPPPAPTWCGVDPPHGVASLASEARSCYSRTLATNPTASGRVVVELSVDAQGNASGRIASSTMNDPPLEQCLVTVFTRRRWPCSAGDVKIPIAFAPPVP